MPADVLAQLGNRVQHALRALRRRMRKPLKATASTFPRTAYDMEEVLTQLGIGEAVITVLSERGRRSCRLDHAACTRGQHVTDRYCTDGSCRCRIAASDRARPARGSRIAYERLATKLAPPPAAPTEAPPAPEPRRKEDRGLLDNPVFKTVATAAVATLGREIVRGILGTRRRRRR
jgi:uncharacterized protein